MVGDYSNFEALEAEFDRFNEYYPNVELSYVKPDKYKELLGTVLSGENAPNIFFSFNSWKRDDEGLQVVFDKMEDLSDPQLGLDLGCIRPGLLSTEADGRVLMVPIFARNYGMLVNNDLFAKEGLQVPTTWEELLAVCEAFLGKGYASPIMGYSAGADTCLMNTLVYPEFVAAFAADPDAPRDGEGKNPALGKYMRPGLEAMMQLIGKGYINLEKCNEIADNYTEVILRFFMGDVPMMLCTVRGVPERAVHLFFRPCSAVRSRRLLC